MRIDAFRDADAFRRDDGRMLRTLRTASPAEGQSQVYVAGQKEREHELRYARWRASAGKPQGNLGYRAEYGVSL